MKTKLAIREIPTTFVHDDLSVSDNGSVWVVVVKGYQLFPCLQSLDAAISLMELIRQPQDTYDIEALEFAAIGELDGHLHPDFREGNLNVQH